MHKNLAHVSSITAAVAITAAYAPHVPLISQRNRSNQHWQPQVQTSMQTAHFRLHVYLVGDSDELAILDVWL